MVVSRIDRGEAVLAMSAPPQNALSVTMRGAICASLQKASDDPQVKAIVLASTGQHFSGGIDLGDHDRPAQPPSLSTLCAQLENCPKPVVAALNGLALGAGFELALAAHARVAAVGARLGLPDVLLGMSPAGGATQRLPRIVGAKQALDLMLAGRPVSVEAPLAAGLVQEIVDQDVVGRAVSLALEMHQSQEWKSAADNRNGFAEPLLYQDQIAQRRAVLAHQTIPDPAAKAIIDAVEVAMLLPIEAGLAYELALHHDIVSSDRAASLRHLYAAERSAPRRVPLPPADPRLLARVAICGAGRQAAQIAIACLDAGLNVLLAHPESAGRDASRQAISQIYDNAVKLGRLDADTRARRLARLQVNPDADRLASAQILIDTRAGTLGEVGAGLDEMADRAPNAVLATTCSGVDLAQVIAVTEGRSVIGFSFAMAAHVSRVAELSASGDTNGQDLALMASLVIRMGKIAVFSRGSAGAIAARLKEAIRQSAEEMLLLGATPLAIDTALRGFGFSLGPFQAVDSEGLGRVLISRNLMRAGPHKTWRDFGVFLRLKQLGNTGQSAFHGFLGYEGGKLSDDPQILAALAELRREQQVTPRTMSSDEICRRVLAAMVNEAAAMLRQKVAHRASDIDVIAVLGLGFGRQRGGPLKTADMQGVFTLQGDLERFAPGDRAFWSPDALILDLVKNGRHFN